MKWWNGAENTSAVCLSTDTKKTEEDNPQISYANHWLRLTQFYSFSPNELIFSPHGRHCFRFIVSTSVVILGLQDYDFEH